MAIYWFYELAPLGFTQSRLESETNAQQVTTVERGYTLFQANCARCHGANGEGGIGPALNRQDKLFAHLSDDYIATMLEVGGRYACGNPNSVMPVWSNQGHPPGPLNYVQIEDLIAFIRAPSDQTYTVRDAALNEPKTDPVTGKVETFKGWRDVNYKPAPGATPYPACWADEFKTASAAPSGSAGASGGPAASGSAGASGSPAASGSGAPPPTVAPSSSANATVVPLVAQGIKFTTTELTAPGRRSIRDRFRQPGRRHPAQRGDP